MLITQRHENYFQILWLFQQSTVFEIEYSFGIQKFVKSFICTVYATPSLLQVSLTRREFFHLISLSQSCKSQRSPMTQFKQTSIKSASSNQLCHNSRYVVLTKRCGNAPKKRASL